ncbi:type I-E CRISPR-associated protein Cas7/Cse4/CasC [Leptospira kirschneri]|uniref:type I-E CRISPR-associated protein Cas7/Cse4/CasC n=1 Tax=Leptospira kirschneri TaxID=29507 RepID=UPI0009E1A502|nr:type I-E CRISPR-associated protein Cas7/Cse4/CasC [Leptospira kirschneri]
MLIEIHILQNHVPSNLNRDDTGSVKDCTFGGVPRARISSQCLKRSIRKSDFFKEGLGISLAERTKFLPEEIKLHLISNGVKTELAEAWALKLTNIGKSDKKKADSDEKNTDKKKVDAKAEALYQTAQLMFYGGDELKRIVDSIVSKSSIDPTKLENKEVIKLIQDSLKDLKSKPVDIALFGRMTTMEAFEDTAATCQVSHAISVNKHAVDFDYFTAVDDLSDKYREDSGSAHIGEIEFTSACFYKYISVDYESFLKLLGKDSKAKVLGKSAISALIKAAALTNPTGKQNSFAAHNPPHFIGIEIKDKKVPVNLANAFVKPIIPDSKLSLNDKSIEALAKYAKRSRDAFSLPMKDQAHFVFTEEKGLGDEFSNQSFKKLDDLIQWLEKYTGA